MSDVRIIGLDILDVPFGLLVGDLLDNGDFVRRVPYRHASIEWLLVAAPFKGAPDDLLKRVGILVALDLTGELVLEFLILACRRGHRVGHAEAGVAELDHAHVARDIKFYPRRERCPKRPRLLPSRLTSRWCTVICAKCCLTANYRNR